MRVLGAVFSEPFFQSFVITQMGMHQALPQFAVVGDVEVQQFVDNDVIHQFPGCIT